MSLQAETLHLLQNEETTQADHKAVYWIGSQSNARMEHIPPLFQDNQKLDESELVDYLANKAPRSHKAMLTSQGFNPETGDLDTFVEHCKQAGTTDNIAKAKFAASDEESDTKRKKNRPKFKEKDEHGNKRHKKTFFALLISPW